MKKIFNYVMSFLRTMKTGEVQISWVHDEENYELYWEYYTISNDSIPKNIINHIIDIVQDPIYELINSDDLEGSELGYYNIIAIVKPDENEITITFESEVMDGEMKSTSDRVENKHFWDLFNRKNINQITANVNGSGDNGSIEDIMIDDVSINDVSYTSEEKNLIEFVLYQEMENHFDGWELDDGSSGSVTITSDESKNVIVSIDIEEYGREYVESDYELILTSENIDQWKES